MPTFDQEQVARAVHGDSAALAELLQSAVPALLAEIDRELGSKHAGLVDAHDILQLTCLEAFLRVGDFVWYGPASFPNWLRQIAENNLRDATRALERDKRSPPGAHARPLSIDDSCAMLVQRLEAPITSASRKLSREESKALLLRALEQLPPEYQTVIRLYELEELSGPEVAERMARSHGAVRMLLARARARLAEILGSESRVL